MEKFRGIPQSEIKEREAQSNIALLLPGQGTQEVGMGQKLYNHYESARKIYDTADKILEYPITEISFRDPKEELNQTRITQPAIYVNSFAYLTVLEESHPEYKQGRFVAGHSLGEYNALVEAGAISFEDGLRLIDARARAMQEACEESPSGLVALMKPSGEALEVLDEKYGLKVCLENTEDQIVVGGRQGDIEEALGWMKDHKIKARQLPVNGAFHHPELMLPAAEKLADVLDKTDIRPAKTPVISNVTATPIHTPSEIREELVKQMTHPVKWLDTSRFLELNGVDKTIEAGERGILTNMNKKTIGGVIVTGGITLAAGITAAVLWHRHHEEK